MRFYIFSDESGSWHYGDHYIRSWVKISEEQKLRLDEKIAALKAETGIKELKWNRFSAQPEKLANALDCDFQVYVTVSSPNGISYDSYTVIRSLMGLPDGSFTGDVQLRETCRTQILNSVKNILFLNYFEKIHLESAKKALVIPLNEEELKEYELNIDKPQFQSRHWTNMARDVGFQNFIIHSNSEEVPGIELADCIAGCVSKCFEGDSAASDIFKKYIRPKMCDMTSRTDPNPNLIFYRDMKDAYSPLLTALRS